MRSAALIIFALTGCATTAPRPTEPNQITARLAAADGSDRGMATLRLDAARMRLTVDAMNVAPGARAVHVHGVGRCDGPRFESAGDHWNPAMRRHGRDNPDGAHHGDLPNLSIGTDGRGSLSIDLPGAIAQLIDADGAAVVIHAGADDHKTDPSGNSGDRIACGVLTAP